MNIASKNKLIVILIIILLVIVGTIGFLTKKSSDLSSPQTPKEVVAPFSVDGLNNPDYLLEESDQTQISERIEFFLSKANIKTVNLKGEVRDGSFINTESDDGSRVENTFLVDIPAAKRTYKVMVRHEQDFVNVYILCPSETELKYGAFTCEDDLYEEDK